MSSTSESILQSIRRRLTELVDESYKKFQEPLMPTVDPERILGVRTPALKKLAKELSKEADIEIFLNDLPHMTFEENNLHAFIIAACKDFDKTVDHLEKFLPYVDNWATCDQLRPACFAKNKDRLLPLAKKWTESEHDYTVRFGIGMLMCHFLDDRFDPETLKWVCSVESDEYYVNMMRAWYFATALTKQWDSVLPIFEARRLDRFTHNKSIQKARESFRVPDERKEYLKRIKIC